MLLGLLVAGRPVWRLGTFEVSHRILLLNKLVHRLLNKSLQKCLLIDVFASATLQAVLNKH